MMLEMPLILTLSAHTSTCGFSEVRALLLGMLFSRR